MHRAIIGPDGRLALGPEAERAGFRPGDLVEILVTRAGTLIVDRDLSHDAIDVRAAVAELPGVWAARRLPGRPRKRPA